MVAHNIRFHFLREPEGFHFILFFRVNFCATVRNSGLFTSDMTSKEVISINCNEAFFVFACVWNMSCALSVEIYLIIFDAERAL